MAKVRIEKFCSLATSPSWQAWLFHLDHNLYRRFIKRLQESRGCNQNRDLMIEILKEVEKVGGGAKLIEFLQKHYPTTLVADDQPVGEQSKHRPERSRIDDKSAESAIFSYYNPHLLTYPRRLIITGTDLKKKIQEFLLDKIQSDFVIVGDRAYVEYLKAEDSQIKDKVPQKNWQIAAWRLRTGSQI